MIVDLPSFCSTVRYWVTRPQRSPPRPSPRRLHRARLATPRFTLSCGSQWVYQIKHDGYRFICRTEGNRIRVFSRRGSDYTERVPGIVDTLARLPASVTLDGEGVACGPNGVTNYELLRAALAVRLERKVPLCLRPARARRPRLAPRALVGTAREVGAACYAAPATGSELFDHMEGTTARPRSVMPSPWASKASSRSAAIRPYCSGRSPDRIKARPG